LLVVGDDTLFENTATASAQWQSLWKVLRRRTWIRRVFTGEQLASVRSNQLHEPAVLLVAQSLAAKRIEDLVDVVEILLTHRQTNFDNVLTQDLVHLREQRKP